nr:hypothetical protein [Sphingobium sp. OAS761]
MRLSALQLPCILEHRRDHLHQRRRRLQLIEQFDEAAFDLIAANGFAIAAAVPVEAHIIAMPLAGLAARPVGGQRVLAVIALDAAAQRKVSTDIRTGWRIGAAIQALLYLLEGLEIDQAFMLALAKRYAPIRALDHARVDHPAENAIDRLDGNMAIAALGKVGLAFEEAGDLGLGLETPIRIAFHPFCDDGRERFIAHQKLAVTIDKFIAIAHAGDEGPIALPYSRLHAIARLFGIFAALLACKGGFNHLHEIIFGIVAIITAGRFQMAARRGNRRAQCEMGFNAARQARNVVDNDVDTILAVLAHIG